MSKRTLALLAAFGASIIYGLNHTIAKGVMPDHVKPFGFILLRLLGASALFWAISFWGPKEKIAKKDWGRLFLCAIFGMAINMLSFFKGLSLSTPINSAVLATITPIIVVVLSAILIKEKITLQKGFGVLLGLIGALALILFGVKVKQDAPNIPLGNFLFLVNAISFGFYLLLVKSLLKKYHPMTIMKWLFTIGFLITLPLSYSEFSEIAWQQLPMDIIGAILFVIIGTTFLTYLFNVFALTQLKASTVGVFTYIQPLVGIMFAIGTGKDQLSFIKIIAIVLVIVGVYLVSKPPKPTP
ncbi:Threonine/homoserine efflux transporter RhtA [Arenibacter nanhaiticus]|uniref:Threonine/homoserine efflux transporter RhtA n=1 Tax=Arenibacter nanhaiticus TaxID=558155 RepID=A0A1M6D3K7_9FLAO|nr:DMT family transporter [Arenibacter nanhaiticus]SHI67711.1 Threonine/homoserine efflux transporter RhtA [Arenibacter nanhaiticus]